MTSKSSVSMALNQMLEVSRAASIVHFENVQCEVACVLVHLVFTAEVVPVHSVRLLTRVENSRVLWRRIRWYRH